MNRHVRAEGINGDQVLHAEEIGPDDWRAVDIERNGGICIYNRESLITRIADLIGDGYIYRLLAVNGAMASIDRAGNIWLEHEYLAPHQYLPLLITP